MRRRSGPKPLPSDSYVNFPAGIRKPAKVSSLREIHTLKDENRLPNFTTLRQKIDGEHWFPVKTLGDDILPFRTGPQRIRLSIDYRDYQKFEASSKIIFTEQKP